MSDLMSAPLLSICIPTYNRSQYLKRCIESIICQEEFQKGIVEIVISDNASGDDTENIIQDYVKKYENIIYSKNKENIRDKNFPVAIGMGKGKLRRLCNDTLIFEPYSLKKICEIIKKYELTRPYLFWSNGELEDSLQIEDFQEVVKKTSFWMTSIACFSIWDDECLGIEEDIAGAELLLWQVRKCLELMHKKNGAVICNQKITGIQTVVNKNISYGLYKVFYENFFELLSPYFDSNILDNCTKEFLEKDLLFNFFMEWCINWELANNNFRYSKEENLKRAIKLQYRNKNYWIKYICIYNWKIFKRKIKRILLSIVKK